MIEIVQSAVFESWFGGLKDVQARARITARIRRLSLGNAGDVKPVGAGVSEMRIDYGPGYRVYFLQRDKRLKKWPQSDARRRSSLGGTPRIRSVPRLTWLPIFKLVLKKRQTMRSY